METKSSAEASRLRIHVQQVLSARRIGTAYPADLRNEVMAFTRRRIAAGAKVSDAAREIGMSYWTVWGWFRTDAKRREQPVSPMKRKKPEIVPVQIVATPAPVQRNALVVHGPCGLRIEGADVETLAALLRRLA